MVTDATATDEGNPDAGNPAPWGENFSEEHKESLKGFENQESLFKAIGYEVPKAEKVTGDWKEGLDEEQLKTANRFQSPKEMVASIQQARKRESLVRVPGKEATDEERSAFNKSMGVPETADGYNFQVPEGVESTPEMEASNKEWGERLHGLNVPTETVSALLGFMEADAAKIHAAEVKADSDFVADSEAALKAEWKGEEYNKNKEVANKAFKEIAGRAGVDVEDLKHMETKDGRFLFDDPRMLKMFAVFGREMAEGNLGPTLSEGERDTLGDQLTDIRTKISAAQDKGDSKTANRLHQEEIAIITKMDGNKSIKG